MIKCDITNVNCLYYSSSNECHFEAIVAPIITYCILHSLFAVHAHTI